MKNKALVILSLFVLVIAFLWFEARPAYVKHNCTKERFKKAESLQRLMDTMPLATSNDYNYLLKESELTYINCLHYWGIE